MNAVIIKDLTKKYGDIAVVNNLNLTIKQGELFALLGVNGAGKTTTVKMLSCLIKPTSGDAFLLGDSIISGTHAIKEKTNISPQETAVAENLSVLENLEFIAGIYGQDSKKANKNALDIAKQRRPPIWKYQFGKLILQLSLPQSIVLLTLFPLDQTNSQLHPCNEL